MASGRERVNVRLARGISADAEQHRESHLGTIAQHIRRMFPMAHITAAGPTAEHDTIKVHGVVRWSAEQMQRLSAFADAVEVDCLNGAATMYINKISGYRAAGPTKSMLCLDVAMCIFILAALWTCMHCLFPEWLWSVPTSVETLLSLGDLPPN
jgi:hypothetical protein